MAIRGLLNEAVLRAHNAWRLKWFSASDGNPDRFFLCLNAGPEQDHSQLISEGNQLFARYLRLREAQIEAEIYFGLEAPQIALKGIEDWLAWFKSLPKSGNPGFAPSMTRPITGDLNSRLEEVWRRTAVEYETLWFENCDRIFLIRAEAFTLPLFEPNQFKDLKGVLLELSRTDGAAAYIRKLIRSRFPSVENQLPPPGQIPANDDRLTQLLAGCFNVLLETPCLGEDSQADSFPARASDTISLRPKSTPASRGELGKGPLIRFNRKLLDAVFEGLVVQQTDSVNFQELTRSWLACRQAAQSGQVSVHSVAVDLALALFLVGDDNPCLALGIRDVLHQRYFDPYQQLGEGAPLKGELVGDALIEAGRCAVIYGLWLGSQWNWKEAAAPLNLGLDGLAPFSMLHFNKQSPLVLRAAAHIDAANLRALHGRKIEDLAAAHDQSGGGAWLNKVLAHYKQLDEHGEKSAALFDGLCPGATLAGAFADNLLRLKPIKSE